MYLLIGACQMSSTASLISSHMLAGPPTPLLPEVDTILVILDSWILSCNAHVVGKIAWPNVGGFARVRDASK
jgi:hypothetical protein